MAKNPGACRLCEPPDLQEGQTRPLPRYNRGVPQVKPPGPARHPRGYHSLGSCGGLPGARGELPGPRRPPEAIGAAAEGSRGPRGASSGRLGEGGPGPPQRLTNAPRPWALRESLLKAVCSQGAQPARSAPTSSEELRSISYTPPKWLLSQAHRCRPLPAAFTGSWLRPVLLSHLAAL